ncbi:hypothetical protein L596_014075 [Steinernema carpocapsae]|uniref:Uncharacterized protein n=1 Tax=Steinernema carpocapsae TaxID=34508 RepID=A0A4V6A2N5_STECR|nr:hypothetical protein L596_014075 [Steinernema carpocapsae]
MSTQTAKLLGVKPERDPQFAVNERTITEQEFREQYMHPNLQIAAQINLPFEDIGWCDISETRLFKKCVFYKPAGQLRSLNMIVLVHEMHHISENDPMTDYRDELTPEDLKIYRERLRTGEAQRNPRTYTPAYKVRPNAMAIMNKLNEYWNMPLVHRRELAANDYFKQVDFELPPEIKKMKEHRIQRDEATQ